MITNALGEKVYNQIEIITEENECAGCHKRFNQNLLITPFGIICGRFCDECINKYEAAENSKNKC